MATADIPAVRVCTKCGDSKPATTEFFNRHLRGKYGLKAWCRLCTTAVRRLQKQGEKVGRAEVWPEGFKRCSVCSTLKRATEQFFFLHPEGRLGLRPDCKKCNLAKCLTRWNGMTKRQQQERNRAAYARRDYETRCSYPRNYRARKRAAAGNITANEIKSLLAKQRGKCWWCAKPVGKYHVDHVIPLCRGGSNHLNNVVISCARCNLSKGRKLPWEWEGGRLL